MHARIPEQHHKPGVVSAGGASARDAKARVIARALELGFDVVGIAAADSFVQERRVFERRAAHGMLGQWRYPAEKIALHTDPSATLPGARSIICTAISYATSDAVHDPYAPGLRGAVSRHSWGRDYHRVIGGKLRTLAEWIQSEFPSETCVACVDTGPLVDRAAAVRAGLGWFGKNANVLTRDHGSWVLLGELITTMDLAPDQPLAKNCGECRVCIDRCPTGAIGPDGAIDARRCISDLTQLNGPIPRELRPSIGNRIWGCDDCQTFCPVNERKARGSNCMRGTFAPLAAIGTSVDLPSVLHMTKSRYKDWFKPTSMAWRGKAVLQRNAAVALGNSRDARAVAPLVEALKDRKPLVRGHAAWALGRLGAALSGANGRVALLNLLDGEKDEWVREEAAAALTELTVEST